MRNFSNFSATLLILITCFESLQLTYLWSFSHFVKKHTHPPRNTFYLHWSNYQSVVNMSRRMIHFVIRARVPPTDFYTLFFYYYSIPSRLPFQFIVSKTLDFYPALLFHGVLSQRKACPRASSVRPAAVYLARSALVWLTMIHRALMLNHGGPRLYTTPRGKTGLLLMTPKRRFFKGSPSRRGRWSAPSHVSRGCT